MHVAVFNSILLVLKVCYFSQSSELDFYVLKSFTTYFHIVQDALFFIIFMHYLVTFIMYHWPPKCKMSDFQLFFKPYFVLWKTITNRFLRWSRFASIIKLLRHKVFFESLLLLRHV